MDTRQETIDRYWHLREVAKGYLSGALKHLSKSAINDAARRVGLLSRGTIVAESFDEMTLAFDLAVLGPHQRGRSSAIDRYARTHPPAPGSDEAVTLGSERKAGTGLVSAVDSRSEEKSVVIFSISRERST